VCYAQWRTTSCAKLWGVGFARFDFFEVVAKYCKKGKMGSKMAQRMGNPPQRNVAGLHAPRMMGTQIPLEVRHGSRVDDSHTIVTIPVGNRQRIAGIWLAIRVVRLPWRLASPCALR
jgi:hypothetical protein